MPNDYFRFRQFTVRQDRCAMKVGTDGTLLGAWASPSTHHPASITQHHPASILDIGTGTGLVTLMMAQRFPQARVTAIDIDPQAVSQARENVAASPFADRIDIVEGDVRDLPPLTHNSSLLTPNSSLLTPNSSLLTPNSSLLTPNSSLLTPNSSLPFDAIVCNPPYFDASLPSPDAQRTLARHTATLSYRELMDCAWRLLADDGRLSLIIPFDCKARLEAEAALTGFHCVAVCAVRTTPRKPPRRFLMAFSKHSSTVENSELVIGSEACNELTSDFYL